MKKIFTILLVLAMVLTCFGAFADGDLPLEEENVVNEVEEEEASFEQEEEAPVADQESVEEKEPEEVASEEAKPEEVATEVASEEVAPEVKSEEAVPEAAPEAATEVATEEAVPEVTSEEVAPEATPIVFVEGYVRINAETTAYAEMNDQKEAGAFAATAVVYAEMAQEGEDFASSWLKVTFDTEEAKEAEADFAVIYVLGEDVEILEQDEVDALTAQWAQDLTMRIYKEKALPIAKLQAKAEEKEEPVAEEPVATSDDDLFDFGDVEEDLFATETDLDIVEEEPKFEFDIEDAFDLEPASDKEESEEKVFGLEEVNEIEDEADFGSEESVKETDEVVFEMNADVVKRTLTEDDEKDFGSDEEEASFEEGVKAEEIKDTEAVEGEGLETKDTEAVEDTEEAKEAVEDTEEIKEIEAVEGAEGVKDSEEAKDAEAVEGAEEVKDSEEVKDAEAVEEITEASESGEEEAPSLITVQPKNTLPDEEGNVSFSVEAEGEDLVYQWQMSDDGEEWKDIPADSNRFEGADTATLSFKVTGSTESKQFRCVVSDGTITSESKAVTIGEEPDDLMDIDPEAMELVSRAAPQIVAQADTTGACEGQTVKYTATISNLSGDLKYQWERSSDNGTTWINTTLPGYNSPTLTFDATESRLSYLYRLTVTKGSTPYSSNGVRVVYANATADKTTVVDGEKINYTVKVKNLSSPTSYQWERSSDNGKNWSNTSLSGNTSTKLSFYATAARMSYQYRCKITTGDVVAYSNAVSVTYYSKPTVTAVADKTCASSGQKITYTATTYNITGSPTYQWERSNDGGKNWSNTSLTGYNTKQLSFDMTVNRLSYEYRCSVTVDGKTYSSDGVKVAYATAASNVSTASAGQRVTYTASVFNATGSVSYQWQRSNDNGKSWSSTSLTGNNTNTLYFDATQSRLSYQYRCAVTINNKICYSNGVKVTLNAEPNVVAVADKACASEGETITYTATPYNISGNPSFKWERSNDNGKNWISTTLSGYNTNKLTFAMTTSRLAYQYRCVVTVGGETYESNGVKVAYATASADKTSAGAGQTVTYTVTVKNSTGTPSYQWQRSSDGKSWSNTSLSGNATNKLSFEATSTRLSYQYRCAVTINNKICYSNGVKVTYSNEPIVKASANLTYATSGQTVSYTAKVENGAGTPSYQWKRSSDNGKTWTTTSLSGYNTPTLSFEANEYRLAYQYMCEVTLNSKVYPTNAVTVVYSGASANKSSTYEGQTVTYTAVLKNATGTPSYQWKRSIDNGKTWTNTSLSGYNTNKLSFEAQEYRLSYLYRCEITVNGTTYPTNAVRIVYADAKANKTSVTANENVNISVTVKNNTATPTYQWQRSSDGKSWSATSLSGNKTAKLTFDATESRCSYQYRCAVTIGSTVYYSDAVKVDLIVTTYTKDSVTYEIIDNTTARVKSFTGSQSSVTVLGSVTIGGAAYTVTEIGEEAFMGKTSLTSVSLPNSITAIRARAFKNCTNLSTMTSY